MEKVRGPAQLPLHADLVNFPSLFLSSQLQHPSRQRHLDPTPASTHRSISRNPKRGEEEMWMYGGDGDGSRSGKGERARARERERERDREGDCSSKSDISCHGCRRRKVRCGRELPHCVVCEQTSQDCEYPARMLKPGPKIGSTHRNRKRRRGDGGNDDGITSGQDSNAIEEDSGVSMAVDTSSLPRDNNGGGDSDPTSTAKSGHPSSSKGSEIQDRTRHDSINIHDLSFILHPSHEAPTPQKNTSPSSTSDHLEHGKSMMMIAHASHALGVIPDVLEKMIKIYFENMTAINIFHEPSFPEKLLSIESPPQTNALLASMLAYSARFNHSEYQEGQDLNFNFEGLTGMEHSPEYFLELASRFVEESLRECGNEAPSLCVLQAQILIAHGQLTQGVRGKAWRSLGTCVRLAYELNLHLVDTDYPPEIVHAKLWCDYEEERRAWWAVWEMDVFASTVRRCPTAVDWSQIETLLPVEDEYWFQGKPRVSCFLEQDPVRRWKELQKSGNQSAKAWFLVINSLMKEAQLISSPRGILNRNSLDKRQPHSKPGKDQLRTSRIAEEARDKLEMLSNCVYCFVLALPPSLKFRNQYLRFDARQPGETSSPRQRHCGIYNIHVMTQLSRLMIHHYDIFSESARAGRTSQDRSQDQAHPRSTPGITKPADNVAMHQYFEAADEILTIVQCSSDTHIQHINAFLASTIWLASAVQVVRKVFGSPGTNRSLVKSKFEVLNMTYKKCVSFWGIQTAMQENLETLEAQLEMCRIPVSKKQDQGQRREDSSTPTKTDSWTKGVLPDFQAGHEHVEQQSNNGNSLQYEQYTNNASHLPRRLNHQSNLTMQNHSSAASMLTMQRQQQQLLPPKQQAQARPISVEPLSPALSALEYMHFPTQIDKDPAVLVPYTPFMHDRGMFSDPTEDQQGLNADAVQGLAFGLQANRSSAELPNYIDELLSGAYMYMNGG